MTVTVTEQNNQVIVSTTGSQGPAGGVGPAGTSILNGTSAPQSSDGNNGDFFLETTNSRLYGPKAGGAWLSSYVSLIGPTGSTGSTGSAGSDGSDGSDGQDGKTLLNGSGAPSGGNNGDFWIDTTNNRIYGPKANGSWPSGFTSIVGPQGQIGQTGSTGASGAAATISVGSVSTGAAGSSATVSNSGSSGAATLDFTIPRGDVGAQGATGAAASISVGSTNTGSAGSNASVSNSGSSGAATFNFTIPRGETGATGSGATVAAGTTTTSNPGTNASVSNSGSSSAATFNFTIPRGDVGAAGPSGSDGSDGQDGKTLLNGSGAPGSGLGNDGDFYIDTTNDDLYGPKASGSWGSATSIVQGATGPTGSTGNAASIAVGTVSTGSAGSSVSITNSGSSSAATFDFTIPRGDTGSTGPAGQDGVGITAGDKGDVTVSGTGNNTWVIDNNAITNAKILDDTIAESKLDIHAAPSENKFLGYTSNGMEWAVPPDTNTTYSVGDNGLTQNNFTDALKTKLDGIETSATADQTGAEIKTAYEAESDTNAFTDALKNKLDGIAASANVGITDVVGDTTPQLGGDLDVQTSEIKTAASNRNIKLNPHGSGVVEIKGDGSSNDGTIQLNCSQNSHGIKIKSPAHSAGASYTITFPDDIQNGKYLTTDASGNTSWGTPTNTTYSVQDGELSQNNFTNTLKTKLDGIEASATADQTGAEIKSAYEGESNTNAFTNTLKTKLDGIATGAEVNVQSDWNETSNSSDAYIQNKPTIPTDTDTTYAISCVDGDNTDEEKIRLTAGGDGSGTDDVVLEAGTGLSVARSGDKITFTNTVTDTNTQLSTEEVQDIIGGMVSSNTETNISVTYDDTNGKLNFVSTDTNTEYSVGDGGLTTNDFTNADHTKLNGIAASANNYAISSDLLDEDDMSSDSATKVPSQQSTKAYVDTADALKANIASPTFTGTPAVPTAAANTNTTQIASTAFVMTEVGDYAPLTGATFSGSVTFQDAINENVFAITDASSVAIDPDNGTIQTWTLGASRTATDSVTAGQAVLLMITAGSNTLTWPTMTWAGGTAPTLSTSSATAIEIWKVGSTLYGANVGDV